LRADSHSSGDSFAGNLTAGQKEKNKKPSLRIFENFFCSRTFGTFTFAPFYFFDGRAKVKEPNPPTRKTITK
jgi:hypothetical protein